MICATQGVYIFIFLFHISCPIFTDFRTLLKKGYFLGFVVVIGHVQLSLQIMGAPLGYRPINSLSTFAENCVKGVYTYQDDT